MLTRFPTPQDAEQFIRELARDFTDAIRQAGAHRSNRRITLTGKAVIERGVARLKQRDAGIRRQTIEEIRTRAIARRTLSARQSAKGAEK
jgi:hypothetical protein